VTLKLVRGQRLRIASAAVFTHGNRHRTGSFGCWLPPDRAALDARQHVTLLGRRGTTVKIAGRRVNLAEVAARLRRLSGVRDAWVTTSAGPDPVLGTVLATQRPVPDLRAELQSDTAAWKVPKKWATVPDFPLTGRGKTDTRALAALLKW
jgi:acyl-coenzyme A synthetase/AMP-(fatty) acid ligase